MSNTLAQELSNETFPSEDEIIEALQLGEITVSQYNRLQEIAALGVDSNSMFLLDEIPNLTFFSRDSLSNFPPLQKDQLSGFIKQPVKKQALRGVLSWQFYQRLEEKGNGDESRYRFGADIRLSPMWRTDFRIHREYNGEERFVRRTVTYHNRDKTLQRVRIGNYSERLGLGTVIGYRGKLIDFSSELGNESFLFPDYGGLNGFQMDIKRESLSANLLASMNRDSVYSMVSVAAMVGRDEALFPSLIAGYNRIRNRVSDEVTNDIKLAAYSNYRYALGYVSFEVTTQLANNSGLSAIVTEGKHRFGDAEIKYAGWIYDNNYLDLSGGSKSALVTRRFKIDDDGPELNTRRSGQAGFLVRTQVLFASNVSLQNSLLIGRINSDSSNVQLSSGIRSQLSPEVQLEMEFIGRYRTRVVSSIVSTRKKQQIRLSGRYGKERLKIRSYLAYNSNSGRKDFISILLHLRYRTNNSGRIDFWSNLSRLEQDGIGYWYVYAQAEQQLTEFFTGLVKLAHTFQRAAIDESRPVVSFRLEARI